MYPHLIVMFKSAFLLLLLAVSEGLAAPSAAELVSYSEVDSVLHGSGTRLVKRNFGSCNIQPGNTCALLATSCGSSVLSVSGSAELGQILFASGACLAAFFW